VVDSWVGADEPKYLLQTGTKVIERLADALEVDALELLRIAGREASNEAFEMKVLTELAAIRSGLERLEATVGTRFE
jgi:hypothetical protein